MAEYGAKLTADASGFVAGTGEATKAQNALNESLGKASTASNSTAAQSKAFVDRLKEQSDTLGKTRSEVDRYRAAHLDLTAAQKESVNQSVAEIAAWDKKQAVMSTARTVVLAAALALGAYAVESAAAIKSNIDQAAATYNLSQSIGISSESLSVYRYQMSLVGVGQEEFGMSMKTLARNTAEASAGYGNGSAVLRLLGGDILATAQQGATLEQLLPKIADAFSKFADGPNKSAIALLLFGRAGEQMIPLLNQGAGGFRAAAAESAEFGRIIGQDVAKQADQFNSNMVRVNAILGETKQAIAKGALPELNAITDAFIKGTKEAGVFTGAWRAMVEIFASHPSADTNAGMVAQFDSRIAQLQASGARPGDQTLAGQQLSALLAGRSRLANAAPSTASGIRNSFDPQSQYFEFAGGGIQPQAPTLPGAYENFAAGAAASGAELDHQIASSEKLTQAQQALIKLTAEYKAGLTSLTPQQYAEEQATLKTLDAKERLLLNRQRDIEIMAVMGAGMDAVAAKAQAQVDVITNAARAYDESNKQLELETQLIQSDTQRQQQLNTITSDRFARIQLETRLTAEANAEREKANALRQIDLQFTQQFIALGDAESAGYQKRLEDLIALTNAQKAHAVALIDSNVAARQSHDAAERSAKEWQAQFDRTSDNLERTLSQALVTGFMEGGKSGGEVLKRAIESSVATMVLEPMLKPLLMPISQWATSASMSMFGPSGAFSGGTGSLFGYGGLFGAGAAPSGTAAVGYGGAGDVAMADGSIFAGGAGASAFSPGMTAGIYGLGAMGAIQLAQGGGGRMTNTMSGAMSGAAMGTMIMPGIGTAVGAVAGALLGNSMSGGQGKDPTLSLLRDPANGRFWFSQTDLLSQSAGDALYNPVMAELNDRTKYDPAMLSTLLGTASGPAGTSAQQLLQQLLARAAPAAIDLPGMLAQQSGYYTQLQGYAGQFGAGINSLQSFEDALAVSGASGGGPLDQLAASKGVYQSALAKVQGGDLSSISSLTSAAQNYLTLGRSVYASGGDYQAIYSDVKKALDDTLGTLQKEQKDILAELPATIQQASIDQVSAINKGFADTVAALKALTAKINAVRDPNS